ncbi:MAG: hypothetical protein NXH71_13205, partial [Erythrobacteraceae bacterium]|nr:hypothetical protein [Erythrobacteraceae bacterium]
MGWFLCWIGSESGSGIRPSAIHDAETEDAGIHQPGRVHCSLDLGRRLVSSLLERSEHAGQSLLSLDHVTQSLNHVAQT